MTMISGVLLLLVGVACRVHSQDSFRYTPDWESLDSRPLPTWYDEAKFGIFIHWGVWSVPAFGPKQESAFLWIYWKEGVKAYVDFMNANYPPDITYADFAADFKAEFYDPNQWADVFKSSGAQYVVLTSKHHEGFTNWPSKFSWNWNSMDVGPKRDLVGELASAIRNRTNIHFGLYHSLYEWYNPLYVQDKASQFKTQQFIQEKTMPELYEIVNAYKPDVIWSDGDWEATPTYWNSTNFLAWLYNDSPVKDSVVTNDRWGVGSGCKHGGFFTCSDKYNPRVLQKHKWENCLTLDYYSWGYRKNLEVSDVLSMKALTTTLAETISCGGNMLLNVGPTSDGRIPPIFEERLRQMGDWLKVNGEAVYGSKPWKFQNDTFNSDVWYTSKASPTGLNVYAIVLNWPATGTLVLKSPTPTGNTKVSMLGYSGTVSWHMSGTMMNVVMPLFDEHTRPCEWAWVMKMENLASENSEDKYASIIKKRLQDFEDGN